MSIDGIDAYVSEYPALIADRYSKSIKSYYGGCTVTCNYYCKTYVNFSAYVTNSDRAVTVTFLAGGGDVYDYSTV